jgi:large subunit ribosomal protein L29
MKTRLKEIRDKSAEDLKREVLDRTKHLFDLRSQAVTEKLEDPSQLRKTRKEIAQIKTILRERELAEAKQAEPKKAEAEKPASKKTGSKKSASKKKTESKKKTTATK